MGIIFLCVIKKKRAEADTRYEPVEQYDKSYGSQIESSAPLSTAPTPVAVKASKPPVLAKPSKSVISCRIVCHFDATDESVLAVGEGDIVRVLPKDFQDGGDWV